jgi:hypothetical protein
MFRTCPHRPWGLPSLLYNKYRVFLGGKERPGRDADPSPPSSAVGHERIELYLYSPYGPYGLYRASVPVQECTLPFYLTCTFTYLTPRSRILPQKLPVPQLVKIHSPYFMKLRKVIISFKAARHLSHPRPDQFSPIHRTHSIYYRPVLILSPVHPLYD